MEYGESRLTMEWRQMTQEERIEEALLAFEKNIEEVEQTRNPAHLRSAASSLSVMKADLCATPEGRKPYERMESRYDELEEQLDQ